MIVSEAVLTSVEFDEAVEVLQALGYKKQEVDKVMNTLSHEQLDTNGYVKKAYLCGYFIILKIFSVLCLCC